MYVVAGSYSARRERNRRFTVRLRDGIVARPDKPSLRRGTMNAALAVSIADAAVGHFPIRAVIGSWATRNVRSLVPETIFSDLANLLNERQKPGNPLRFNCFISCGKLIGNLARSTKMYERSPQKSPQWTNLNLQCSVITADPPNALARVPKSFCGVLTLTTDCPRKHSRQSELPLQAIASGMSRLERKCLSIHASGL